MKSAAEVSELLGVSRNTVKKWIDNGLPVEKRPEKEGDSYLIDVGVAVRWLQDRAADEAKDDDRTPFQPGLKNPFTGTIKIITIHKREHFPAGFRSLFFISVRARYRMHFRRSCVSVMIWVTTPQTCISMSAPILISGYLLFAGTSQQV